MLRRGVETGSRSARGVNGCRSTRVYHVVYEQVNSDPGHIAGRAEPIECPIVTAAIMDRATETCRGVPINR